MIVATIIWPLSVRWFVRKWSFLHDKEHTIEKTQKFVSISIRLRGGIIEFRQKRSLFISFFKEREFSGWDLC